MESITKSKNLNSIENPNNYEEEKKLSFFGNWKNRLIDDGICMEYFSKANLFILCCVAACFSLIICLASFSCEVSWILELRGDLPTPAYLLCTFYFMLFVASIILIHGLATGLSWGLFCWSIIVGTISVPELCLVMYMTIQYWGLQSNHGLVELVGYLVRLVITCLTLICVIPTALRWRHEKKILKQLQSLASRLQISTPNQQHQHPTFTQHSEPMCTNGRKIRPSRRSSGCDNPGFLPQEHALQMLQYVYNPFGSQNEFNASVFGLSPSQYIGPPIAPDYNTKRTQSLLDLRCMMPPPVPKNPPFRLHPKDSNKTSKSDINEPLNNEIYKSNKINEDELPLDPIYYTIDSIRGNKPKGLSRNCVSLENLSGVTSTIKNDLNSYGNNLLKNYQWPIITYHPNVDPMQYSYYPPNHNTYHSHHHQQQQQQQQHRHPHQYHTYNGGSGYNNNQNNFYVNSSNNSRQSLGAESDDYRKYRDVQL